MAGKLPWWRMFGREWLAEPALQGVSLEAEGAWFRLCCAMREKGAGTITCNYSWLVLFLRQRNVARTTMLLRELEREHVGDFAFDDAKGEVAITSRRVTRDVEAERLERESGRERVKRFRNANETRKKRSRNGNVTAESQKSESESEVSPHSSETPRAPARPPSDVDLVLEHYRRAKPKARPGPKERKLIAKRLEEGRTVAALCEAIDGCMASPFHAGKLPGKPERHQTLELIVRDSAHVDKFLDLAEAAKDGSLAGSGATVSPMQAAADAAEREVLARYGQVPLRDQQRALEPARGED